METFWSFTSLPVDSCQCFLPIPVAFYISVLIWKNLHLLYNLDALVLLVVSIAFLLFYCYFLISCLAFLIVKAVWILTPNSSIYQSSIHLLLMIALLPFLCSTVLSFLRVVGWVQDHRIIHQVLAASQGQWLDPEGAWPSWMAQSIDELKNLSRLLREGGTVGGGI